MQGSGQPGGVPVQPSVSQDTVSLAQMVPRTSSPCHSAVEDAALLGLSLVSFDPVFPVPHHASTPLHMVVSFQCSPKRTPSSGWLLSISQVEIQSI